MLRPQQDQYYGSTFPKDDRQRKVDGTSPISMQEVSAAGPDGIPAIYVSKNEPLDCFDESEDGIAAATAADNPQNDKFVQAKNMKNKRALRREQLSRLSTSCPSLDAGWRAGYTSSLDVTQEEDEEIAPDSPVTEQLRHRSLDDESIPDEQDEEAAEAADMNPGRSGSSSSSLEDGLRIRLAKSRSSSKEDSRITTPAEERSKVKRTSSLAKKTSSAGDGVNAPGKSSLTHRASIADPRSRSSVLATKNEAAAMMEAPPGETARAPVQRRGSFKSPMAGLHSGANHFASRLFGLDKSRSASTPSINVDVEPEQAGVGAELRLRAETNDPSRKVVTVKRRPSLFANLFASHHSQDDAGSRRKSESGNRLSMAFSILGGHHHPKGKDGNDEAKKYQHTYLPAPAVDGSPCGACGKPADGKQALQCSGCLVIVHDSCKNVPGIPCMKNSKLIQQKAHSLLQPSKLISSVPPRCPKGMSNTMVAPVRRNSLSSLNAPQDMPFITLTPEGSMLSTMSGSMESSTEDASSEDLEIDVELLPMKPMPDSWSDTMDKKAIKKLNAKYIQRQDCIWEFISSERQYVRALKIAQKVFARGMAKFCHFSRDVIERLFPGLDSLVEMHVGFLERLLQRQNEQADRSVNVVGDIVLEQFGGYLGARVKATYGKFVSKQREGMDCYKDLLRTNSYFEAFVKRSTINPNVNFTIPDIMNIIAQRMQKYRVHLDQLVKNTKESKDKFDKDNLTKAADCVKRIMDHIVDATELRKKELRLIDIYTRTDVRSVAAFNGTSMFRKSDLLSNGRRLLFEGIVSCKNAREKESDVLLLLLSDVVVFLQESSQRYSFFPPDTKSLVLPLDDLTVRDKSSSKDNRSFSMSRRSVQHGDSERGDILELSCKTPTEKRDWAERLSKAVHECESSKRRSDEAADDDDAVDGASYKAVEQLARVNELIERLQVKDEEINILGSERLQTSRDLHVEYGRVDEQGIITDIISTKYGDDNEFAQAVDLIRAAHAEVLRLASAYLAYPFMVPPPISAGPGDHMLPASQVAANSQQRASIATLLPPGSPLGHESFFGSFGRARRLGRSVEDVRNAGRGSIDSDSDGTAASSAAGPRPASAKPQWIKKWAKESSQGDGHPEMQDGKKPMVTTAQLTVPGFTTSSKPSGAVSPSAWSAVEAASVAGTAAPPLAASAPGQQLAPDCVTGAQVHTNASHLSEYLQAVLLITNNQDSTISRYKQLATEFNVRIRELNQELEKTSQEKNAFPHNKQLEEIRSIREQITAERQRWETEKNEVQQHNEDERVRLEQLKHDLDMQREALAKEREELLQQQQQQQSVAATAVPDGPLREPANRPASAVAAAAGRLQQTAAGASAPAASSLADLDSATLALGRSLSADTKSAAAEAGSATAAGDGGSGGSRSPRWSSPLAQRRVKPKEASQSSATSALVKIAVDVTAAGGLHAGRDKKRTQAKR